MYLMELIDFISVLQSAVYIFIYLLFSQTKCAIFYFDFFLYEMLPENIEYQLHICTEVPLKIKFSHYKI